MLPFVGIDYQALPANIEEFSLQLARKRLSDKSRKPGDVGALTCVWSSKAAQPLIRSRLCVAMA